LTPADVPEPVEFLTLDVSFISLRTVLPPLTALLAPGARGVALVKPQFEAGREHVGKGGVVRDPAVHRRVLRDLLAWLPGQGLQPEGVTYSPIRGPKGNVEFLLAFRYDPAAGENGGGPPGEPARDLERDWEREVEEAVREGASMGREGADR